MKIELPFEVGDTVWAHPDDPEQLEVVGITVLLEVRKPNHKRTGYIDSGYVAETKEELLRNFEHG